MHLPRFLLISQPLTNLSRPIGNVTKTIGFVIQTIVFVMETIVFGPLKIGIIDKPVTVGILKRSSAPRAFDDFSGVTDCERPQRRQMTIVLCSDSVTLMNKTRARFAWSPESSGARI